MRTVGRFWGMLIISMLLGVLFIDDSRAEVKKFMIGSGPMGGPWRIGLGAFAQTINEHYKDKKAIGGSLSKRSGRNQTGVYGSAVLGTL